jgi:hypothetical protein
MASFTLPWASAAGDTVAAFYDNAFRTKTAAPSVCLDYAIEVLPLGHQRWRPNLAHRPSAKSFSSISSTRKLNRWRCHPWV